MKNGPMVGDGLDPTEIDGHNRNRIIAGGYDGRTKKPARDEPSGQGIGLGSSYREKLASAMIAATHDWREP